PPRFHQTGQVKTLAPLEQLPLRLGLLSQAPQTNESPGGIVVKLIAGLVRRQLLAVEAMIALTANNRRFAFEQLDADRPAHVMLIARHIVKQVDLKRAEPQSIID